MFYIKLETDQGDLNLVVTQRETIYRGDNLNQKIRYLIPLTVGDIDMLTAFVYLNYIRADGTPDIVRLDRLEEKYNESYYEYVFPVTCKLTKYPGEICTWMQIFHGSLSNPVISKTGECMLQIEESKNMDDYLCDHQITAIYQLQAELNEQGDKLDDVGEELATKADGLVYDAEEESLTLTSDGEEVGTPIDVSDMVNKDDVIHFGSGDTPADDPDAVIYF